ncbi:MAG TPA: CoA pyrophosphatase [Rhizomicrobium sp.]|nr:CoA pyrophosphatase [Rhizomicrobium sp.]
MSTVPSTGIARQIAEAGAAALRPFLLAAPPMLPLSPQRGDYDLNPQLQPASPRELAPAAVLVPIVRHAAPTVLFTRRTEHLARHAGQVSFPGGRLHPDDASLVATALRETREETGIEEDHVSVAGFLDAYETGTGFAILPVIGVLAPGFSLEPNPHEVAEIFEVPLAFLFDPASCSRDTCSWHGQTRAFHAFTYNGHYIWGATAAIVVNLRERLYGAAAVT